MKVPLIVWFVLAVAILFAIVFWQIPNITFVCAIFAFCTLIAHIVFNRFPLWVPVLFLSVIALVQFTGLKAMFRI